MKCEGCGAPPEPTNRCDYCGRWRAGRHHDMFDSQRLGQYSLQHSLAAQAHALQNASPLGNLAAYRQQAALGNVMVNCYSPLGSPFGGLLG